MDNVTDKIASTHLGKKSSGSTTYDSSLLVAVPRIENRKHYDIHNENLPFEGWDVWHGYEFSCLTEKGLPVTRVLKLRYNCSSEFIVESKSLKLYLNSFNMSKFGKNSDECLSICCNLIEKDLGEMLCTRVEAAFLQNDISRENIFSNFVDLKSLINEENITIAKFKESPEVLKVSGLTPEKSEHYLMFDSLRSNCRVTHQPDFGDVFIYYKSCKNIDESSLVEYLVSFRSEYHFHEECCEMIYKRLFDILDKQDELLVCALYTRRGGIDISPVRFSRNFSCSDVEKLIDISKFVRCGIKQ